MARGGAAKKGNAKPFVRPPKRRGEIDYKARFTGAAKKHVAGMKGGEKKAAYAAAMKTGTKAV